MGRLKILAFVTPILVLLSLNVHADQWSKTYGGNSSDKAAMTQQTIEGGYIVLGVTTSFGAGKQDIWVLKLDISGNVEWQKTYGGAADDEASSIQQTADGGFIVAGSTSSFGAGKQDIWVLKLDASGNVEWQKTYGGASDDRASSIQQTADGGFIVAGSTSSFGAGKQDIWVLKLDASGNVRWQKTYGSTGDEGANAVQEISDGEYIVAGWTNSYASVNIEAWILKLDADGNIQWQRAYGGNGDDIAYSIEETLDGKFIVAGSTTSFGAGKEDGWILKLDTNTSIVWQEAFGGAGSDQVFSVQQTMDGGYVAAGWSNSFGAGNGDLWVSKLDSDGKIAGCSIMGTSYATIKGTGVSGVATSATVRDTGVIAQTNSISEGNGEATPNALCLAQGPDIAVDPPVIDFDSVVMGASSSKTVTIRNLGSQDLVIGTIDITGTNNSDFGIREDNCLGQTLQPSSSCTVEVSFSPTANGIRSGNLFIPSNDSDFGDMSVSLNGEGVFPIEPSAPSNHASFSVCSLYSLPTFSWEILSSFARYEIVFSKTTDIKTAVVAIKTKVNETTIKSNLWKKILLIPGEAGGPVYWRVIGFLSGGKTAYLSDYRSITIEPGQPVGDAGITSASMSSLPVISWENNCNVKFKVWFGIDSQFLKKYTIAYTIKNPLDNEGKFSRTLTSNQWDSVRKLVGNQSGSTIHWKVESRDSVNRYGQTATMSFVLEE